MRAVLLIIAVLFTEKCGDKFQSGSIPGSSLQFAGSTPCDNLIKDILGIPSGTPVDFMKWELYMNGIEKSFSLSVNFGISQPNTNGFKPGHDTLHFSGKYNIVNRKFDHKGQVIRLTSENFRNGNLSMAMIGNYLLHILQPDNTLMVGNGGWSYTLNLINKVYERTASLVTMTQTDHLLKDTSLQVVFDGRTPCSDFSREFNLNTVPDCLKLKWRLILNRDPVTLEPSNYSLQRTDIRNTGAITGKWTVFCLNDSTVIYKLDPDKPDKAISFLAGDENVLFFLDKNYRLFAGNSEFSFTLNRVTPVKYSQL